MKDSEISAEARKNNDLIIIGNIEDNSLMQNMAAELELDIKKNFFSWNGKDHSRSDEGLFVSFPNPYNSRKAVYLFTSNSALELYQMTKDRVRMPSWAVYKNAKIVEKGYHPKKDYIIEFE